MNGDYSRLNRENNIFNYNLRIQQQLPFKIRNINGNSLITKKSFNDQNIIKRIRSFKFRNFLSNLNLNSDINKALVVD